MDIFDKKNISPMLIAENKPAFDDPGWIYEIKWDGIRCVIYLDRSGTIMRNKRNKDVTAIYPELSLTHRQVKQRCILDGEVFVLKNGKPNFYEVERRALMTNPFKIRLASEKLPVSFIAYDILYAGSEQINEYPLLERKKQLSAIVKSESPRFAVSRVIHTNGIQLFEAAKSQELEGIVAKRNDSKYWFGIETKDWIKCKALLDDDFVVCGYFMKGVRFQIIIGMYSDGELIYQGHVPVGKNRSDYDIIINAEKSAHQYINFPHIEGAGTITWLEPEMVCVVEFMERTPGGGLRQSAFKGLRDDKAPDECVFDGK